MRKVLIPAIIAAAMPTAACSHERDEGGGATVSRNYSVGAFRAIEVAGPYDVDVRTGANPGVSARGPERLLDRTVVRVEGDKLVIHPENQRRLFNFGWSEHGKARFAVTVPELSGAAIAGSGGIHVDKVRGDRFEGEMAGSGDLALDSVEVRDLKFSIAGSGSARAHSGRAQNGLYEIAGSGGVDAGAVATDAVRVSIAGSGSVKAHASRDAQVEILGSGDVFVTGGAKCRVNKVGSGDVRCS